MFLASEIHKVFTKRELGRESELSFALFWRVHVPNTLLYPLFVPVFSGCNYGTDTNCEVLVRVK